MEENSKEKPAQAVVEPAPDHMCVFVCDLGVSKKCLGRSGPIAYGKREINGWIVMPSGHEYTLCIWCWWERYG